MSKEIYNDEQFSEMREDAFVNIKEACITLQERTSCDNDVVIDMLNEISAFYTDHDQKSKI